MPQRDTRITTDKAYRVVFTREDLIAALSHHFGGNYGDLDIPENADLSVAVPGGGDWSNTLLTLGSDTDGLIVRWTERTESTEPPATHSDEAIRLSQERER